MKQFIRNAIITSFLLLVAVVYTCAQNSKPTPDFADMKYGEHERNVIDIWFAESTQPTPMVIYIHGGGFTAGSKEKIKTKELLPLLEAGISVASISYRYVTIAPFPAPHHDARLALQFIRSKAEEWNIDKEIF